MDFPSIIQKLEEQNKILLKPQDEIEKLAKSVKDPLEEGFAFCKKGIEELKKEYKVNKITLDELKLLQSAIEKSKNEFNNSNEKLVKEVKIAVKKQNDILNNKLDKLKAKIY